MISIHVKHREVTQICIVVVIAIIFALFSLSAHFIEEIYQFLHQYIRLPLTEILINTVFLWIAGTLWMTYRYWRAAVKKQNELENIISSINPDVLVVVDCDRNIKRCNPSVKRMFGYEIHEVINQKTDFLYFDRRSNSSRKYEIHDTLEREGFHLGFATAKRTMGIYSPLKSLPAIYRIRMVQSCCCVILPNGRKKRKKDINLKHSCSEPRRWKLSGHLLAALLMISIMF